MKKRALAIMMCAAMIGTGGINVLAEEAADGYVGDGGFYSMYLRSTFIDWINDLEWYKEAEARTGRVTSALARRISAESFCCREKVPLPAR